MRQLIIPNELENDSFNKLQNSSTVALVNRKPKTTKMINKVKVKNYIRKGIFETSPSYNIVLMYIVDRFSTLFQG